MSATRVVEPGFPRWTLPHGRPCSTKSLPVRSYAFDDRSDLAVRSFPTKKVVSFLTNLYQRQPCSSAQQLKPSLDDLGFDRPTGEPGPVPLGQIAIYGAHRPS